MTTNANWFRGCVRRTGPRPSSFVLALDWAKAFDSISPERLLQALERFGLNPSMLDAIRDIYSHRTFTVVDAGVESTARPQQAGISQGCPLSPFLFGMVMTVLMSDARHMLSPAAKAACTRGALEDILFADDTLLISCCGSYVEEYMAAVEQRGFDYGLKLHWGKVQLVSVGADLPVTAPNGDSIQPVESMLYLGATLHRNGKFSCELARKIGKASAAFKACRAVWKSPVLAKRRKLELLDSLVLNKLHYGVASAWLSKSDLRRLDGFNANCLRRLLKIPSAYFSRVSNNCVREIAC